MKGKKEEQELPVLAKEGIDESCWIDRTLVILRTPHISVPLTYSQAPCLAPSCRTFQPDPSHGPSAYLTEKVHR